jgi:hypothetical protein
VGRYNESLEACLKLLMEEKFPPGQRERIIMNGAHARKKLEE